MARDLLQNPENQLIQKRALINFYLFKIFF